MPAVVGIIFGIAGNVLYFCVRTKYGITLARFISGVGFSLDGSLIGTVRKGFQTFGSISGPRTAMRVPDWDPNSKT